MGGVDVRTATAHALVVAGMVLVVAGVWLLAGGALALLVGGVLTMAYGLLLVNVPVPEQPEQPVAAERGVVPVGPAGASRAGR